MRICGIIKIKFVCSFVRLSRLILIDLWTDRIFASLTVFEILETQNRKWPSLRILCKNKRKIVELFTQKFFGNIFLRITVAFDGVYWRIFISETKMLIFEINYATSYCWIKVAKVLVIQGAHSRIWLKLLYFSPKI